MDNKFFLSIIVPVYNLEDYIIPCIDSIITNKNIEKDLFEIIVVNDGSTDATPKRIEEYIAEHQNFHICLLNQENQGVSAARNHGLSKAKGEFVWFVDGDDAISSDAIFQLSQLESYKMDVIKIGNCVSEVLFEDNGIINFYQSYSDMQKGFYISPYQLLGNEYEHGHTTYIWRRNLLIEKELNYPVGITQNEDFCFLVPALLCAELGFVNLSYRFYLCRERNSSTSRGYFDNERLVKYAENKFLVLDRLLKIQVDNIQKKKYLQGYLNNYIYVMVSDCFFRYYPLSLVFNCLQKLEKLNLYPIQFPDNHVSRFRIWVFNQKYLFVLVCLVYRIIHANKK